MTQERWENLKVGDKIETSVCSNGFLPDDTMDVIMWNYYGEGDEICFKDEKFIYPQDEFDRNDWVLVRDGIHYNEGKVK